MYQYAERKVTPFFLNPNSANQFGLTSLQCMISGSFSIPDVMNLVRQGADPNTKATSGDSLLHFMTNALNNNGGRNNFFVRELVERGADINIQNNQGLTPLACLISNKFDSNQAMYLVDLGACPNTKNNKGVPLLKLLFDKKEEALVKSLIEKYRANLVPPFTFTDANYIDPLEITQEKVIYSDHSSTKVHLGSWQGKAVVTKKATFSARKEYSLHLIHYCNEVSALAKLSELKAENIIGFIGYSIEASPFSWQIVMNYASGGSLDNIIESQKPFGFDDRYDIVKQTINGLTVIHDAGIIHRDIKPANLLMTEGFVIKIADFGLATMVKQAKVICGTDGYMAPEVEEGNKYTEKVDIYSAGITFFDLALWKLNGDPGKQLSRTLIRSKTPEKFRKLILLACKSNPAERPSAKELQMEIQKDRTMSK